MLSSSLFISFSCAALKLGMPGMPPAEAMALRASERVHPLVLVLLPRLRHAPRLRRNPALLRPTPLCSPSALTPEGAAPDRRGRRAALRAAAL